MKITRAPSRAARTTSGSSFSVPARHRSLRGHSILVYCVDYRYSHCVAISDDGWPDDLRLSDIEDRFVCRACGKRGADVRPDFNWDKKPMRVMGYR